MKLFNSIRKEDDIIAEAIKNDYKVTKTDKNKLLLYNETAKFKIYINTNTGAFTVLKEKDENSISIRDEYIVATEKSNDLVGLKWYDDILNVIYK